MTHGEGLGRKSQNSDAAQRKLFPSLPPWKNETARQEMPFYSYALRLKEEKENGGGWTNHNP